MRTQELRYARQAVLFGYTAVVLGALAGLVSSAKGMPGWVPWAATGVVVAGLVFGGLGKAAELRERRTRVTRERQDSVDSRLSIPLSRVSSLSGAQLGVTPTRYTVSGADPYVARPVADAELDALLGLGPPYPFVLVHGDAKAGKSRTVAEVLRRHRASAVAVLPRDGESLAALSRIEPPLETSDAVVVLDDLSANDLEHLTGTVLRYWSTRAVIVATMTTMRYWDVLRTGSDVPSAARMSLYRAKVVELPFELTAAEHSTAQEYYPEEDFTGDGTVSIGETLVGGEELIRKLRAGRDESPAGVAVARAAIDARRAGLMRPILETELQRLFPRYLAQVRRDLAPDDNAFADGLAWAAAPVTSQVSILRKLADRVWAPLDYLVEADAGRPVPPFLWRALLEIAAPFDMGGIAAIAMLAGRTAISREAAENALRYAPHAAVAALFLVENFDNEPDRAIVLCRAAMTANDPEVVSHAAIRLALVLDDQERTDEAVELLERETRLAGPELAASAAYNLGVIRRRHNDLHHAVAAYRQAIAFGNTPLAADAKNNLAVLHDIRGERDEAELLLRDVLKNHPDKSAHAWLTLGVIRASGKDLDSAEKSFRRATTAVDPEIAARAYDYLYAVLRDQGDTEPLRVFADDLIAHNRASANPDVCISVALAFWDTSDDGRARALLQSVADTNDQEQRPRAALAAGMLLTHWGDTAAAEVMFEIAADSEHPDFAPKAASQLAQLMIERGDYDPALMRYRQVRNSGHSEFRESAPGMWWVLLAQGEDEEAEHLLKEITAAGRRDTVVTFAQIVMRCAEKIGDTVTKQLLIRSLPELSA